MLSFPAALQLIQDFADQHPFPDSPDGLYEPCSYIMSLGGKRLRPALAVMAADLAGDHPEAAVTIGWAVELFHNFSLIHDDIMDVAPLRRGKPTVHTQWNLNTGILSGDAMLIYAYRYLAETPNKAAIPALLEVFNRVAIGVCEGQQMDINFEKRDDVSLTEYIRMIELKTAVLLGGALEMGALTVDAPKQDATLLYDFGRLAGIAFQIQDDLLDTYGDPATFGKQVGGDILQNKKTFLVLKTMEVAPEADKTALAALLSADNDALEPTAKIAAVKAIFDRNSIPELVEKEKQQFEFQAFAALDAVTASSEKKMALKGMVGELLHRNR